MQVSRLSAKLNPRYYCTPPSPPSFVLPLLAFSLSRNIHPFHEICFKRERGINLDAVEQ